MPCEASLENIFGPKALVDNFQNSNCVEYSGFGVISSEFYSAKAAMFTCLDGKGGVAD